MRILHKICVIYLSVYEFCATTNAGHDARELRSAAQQLQRSEFAGFFSREQQPCKDTDRDWVIGYSMIFMYEALEQREKHLDFKSKIRRNQKKGSQASPSTLPFFQRRGSVLFGQLWKNDTSNSDSPYPNGCSGSSCFPIRIDRSLALARSASSPFQSTRFG